MALFDMVMESMQPARDQAFEAMMALESDIAMDSFQALRSACGANGPIATPSSTSVKMMDATEALSMISSYHEVMLATEPENDKMSDFRQAFESLNAGINVSESEEHLLARKQKLMDEMALDPSAFEADTGGMTAEDILHITAALQA